MVEFAAWGRIGSSTPGSSLLVGGHQRQGGCHLAECLLQDGTRMHWSQSPTVACYWHVLTMDRCTIRILYRAFLTLLSIQHPRALWINTGAQIPGQVIGEHCRQQLRAQMQRYGGRIRPVTKPHCTGYLVYFSLVHFRELLTFFGISLAPSPAGV